MQAEAARRSRTATAEGKPNSSRSTGIQLWQLVCLGAGCLVGGGALAGYSPAVATLAGVGATLLAWLAFKLYFAHPLERVPVLTRVVDAAGSVGARAAAGRDDAAFFLAVIVASVVVAAAVTQLT